MPSSHSPLSSLLSLFRRTATAASHLCAERGSELLPTAHSLVLIQPEAGEECPICLCLLADADAVATGCGHVYHAECLRKHVAFSRRECPFVSARCPLCRAALSNASGIRVWAASGRPLEVVPLPSSGELCHLDRMYRFVSLGGFASLSGTVYYLLSSNEDRRTPASDGMWWITLPRAATLHLNFRSDRHINETGVRKWLDDEGWEPNDAIASAVSSGVPNGPYSGPVFSKAFEKGDVRLSGSDTWEGVYFVFIQLEGDSTTAGMAAESLSLPSGPEANERAAALRDVWSEQLAWSFTRNAMFGPL